MIDVIGFIVIAIVFLAGAKWLSENVSINLNNKKKD